MTNRVKPTTLVSQVEAVFQTVSRERLRDLVMGLVGIPSPTGDERALAEWAVQTLRDSDLDARLQPIDDRQANAVAQIKGAGTGNSLLVYAPIDTLTVGTEDEDTPWIGESLRPDMRPVAVVEGNFIMGLGASNPKGHAACVMAAVEAVAASGIELSGDLFLGLGAGGMPTNKRSPEHSRRYNTGQGNGCSFMVEQGYFPDYALITKPGWAVAWEEVGLCWFEVRVKGTFNYVGSRHRMHYVNPIVEASKIISGLEEWFPEYTVRHTSGLVAPQGNIGAIEAGWMRMPAVSSAECRMMVDLRISPDTSPNQAAKEFSAAITAIRRQHPEIDVEWDMVLSIPGTSTNPENWIIQSATRAWEYLVERPHEPISMNSGATDANILRSRGIPTARVGMDRIGDDAPLALDFSSGMNVVDLREMERLTKLLIYTIVETCS
jgi:acetylornithine deacetylase/succinyl-diaminopimelate desuccinylase-like protein